MVTSNQKEVLIALSQGRKRFGDLLKHFEEKGLKISNRGLSKTLQNLKENSYIVDSLVDGKKVYVMADAGVAYLDTYYWQLLEEMTLLQREKWPMIMIDNYTDTNQLVMMGNIINQRAYYIVPLALEYHALILTGMAHSIISGKFMNEEPIEFSDIYMISKIKLNNVEKIAKTFSLIWSSDNIKVEDFFDILSNLTARQPAYMKRSIIASLAAMFAVTNIENLTKEQRKKMRDIDRKLGEIILRFPDLTSDLDEVIINLFVEDISEGKDPLMDQRLGNRLIQKMSTPDGKVPMIKNLLFDYLNAAVLKKSDREFAMKVYNYEKGTQGLLIRMRKYEYSAKL